MFVCELDRPWAETSFPDEGFEIETDEDLEAIRKCCEFVYIDLGRTQAVRVKIEKGPTPSFIRENSTSLEDEMSTAEVAKNQTSNLVQNFLDEVRRGQNVDVQLAKTAVSQCVASILRNPDALMLMTRMRQKNSHTIQQAVNTCIYAIILGRLQGLEAKQLEELGTCGLLHDIGNIEIPNYILDKTTSLTEEEFAIVKQHTTYGRDILMSARNIFAGAAEVAYGHHESPDGSGYPRGLVDNQISLNCKIVSVVDKYEAITRHTVYRSAQNHLDAVHILNSLANNNKIDKALTCSFASYMGFYPPGTLVELSTGEVGIVLKPNPKQRLRPQLLIVRDSERNPVERFVDLGIKPFDAKGNPYKIKMVHLPGYLGIDLAQYQTALIQAYD